MAQFGSALGSGLRGRRFKSCRPDHFIYRYLSREYSKRYIKHGELSEWLKEHDWKSCIGRTLYRGFKSHALRHKKKTITKVVVFFYLSSKMCLRLTFSLPTWMASLTPFCRIMACAAFGLCTVCPILSCPKTVKVSLFNKESAVLLKKIYNIIVYKGGGVRC